VDTETGEVGERRLTHREEAEQFYGTLKERSVRVGMEASGHARWFERLFTDLQFELWMGDAAEIRTKRVRKQKTDRQDAQLLLRLMSKTVFPGSGSRTQRIEICGHCSGVDTDWCRCARAS
jgi:transposase